MAGPVSERFAAQVEAMLPFEAGVPPRAVHRKMDGDISTPETVRAALLHLVRSGRAARDGEIGSYRYRRIGGAA